MMYGQFDFVVKEEITPGATAVAPHTGGVDPQRALSFDAIADGEQGKAEE